MFGSIQGKERKTGDQIKTHGGGGPFTFGPVSLASAGYISPEKHSQNTVLVQQPSCVGVCAVSRDYCSLSFFLLQFHARFGERPAMSGSAAGHKLLRVTGLSVHSKLVEHSIPTATSKGFFNSSGQNLTLSLCCNKVIQKWCKQWLIKGKMENIVFITHSESLRFYCVWTLWKPYTM